MRRVELYKISEVQSGKKFYVDVVRLSDNKTISLRYNEVEDKIKQGFCFSIIDFPNKCGREFRIRVEFGDGGEIYYTGFNIWFKNFTGFTTEPREAKLYKSADAVLKAAKKVAQKSGAIVAHIEVV